MRSYLSLRAILLLGLMVHADWHAGRSHHLRLSLEWGQHWLLGLITFALFTWWATRKWPRRTLGPLLLNGVLGLVAGQVLEPLGEVLAYGVSLASVYPPERWRIFLEFTAAGVLGSLSVLCTQRCLDWLRRQRVEPGAGPRTPPPSGARAR